MAAEAAASAEAARRRDVRLEGEALCLRLLPRVPIPRPPTTTPPPKRAGAPWSPPGGFRGGGGDGFGGGGGGGGAVSSCGAPSSQSGQLAYLFELLGVITGLASALQSCLADAPHLKPVELLEAALANRSGSGSEKGSGIGKDKKGSGIGDGGTSSDGSGGSERREGGGGATWPACATARRIPFEPAIDRETGALFLGGGATVAASGRVLFPSCVGFQVHMRSCSAST